MASTRLIHDTAFAASNTAVAMLAHYDGVREQAHVLYDVIVAALESFAQQEAHEQSRLAAVPSPKDQ